MPECSWSIPKHFCRTSEHFCNMWFLWNQGCCCEMCSRGGIGTCRMVLDHACVHRQPSVPSSSASACCLCHGFCMAHTRDVPPEEAARPLLQQEDLVLHPQNLHQAIAQESLGRFTFPLHQRAFSCPSLSLASLGECGCSGETRGLFPANGADSETRVAVPGEILQGWHRWWIQIPAEDPWQSTLAAVLFWVDPDMHLWSEMNPACPLWGGRFRRKRLVFLRLHNSTSDHSLQFHSL